MTTLIDLGKITGIAGIVVGMIVLLMRQMLIQAKDLPRIERANMFRRIQLGAFTIGCLGILAWLVANVAGSTNSGGGGNCSIKASGIGSGGNSISCQLQPSGPDFKP
jgi:hypothetical protein